MGTQINSAEPFGADCKWRFRGTFLKGIGNFFIYLFFSSSAALSGNSSQPDPHNVCHQSKCPCLAIQGRFKIVPAHKIRFDDSTPTRRSASTERIIHAGRSLPGSPLCDNQPARREKKKGQVVPGLRSHLAPVCSTYLHLVSEPSGLSFFFFFCVCPW